MYRIMKGITSTKPSKLALLFLLIVIVCIYMSKKGDERPTEM